MSAILRLYPRAWRERYGDELAVLLEERPASLVDQVDLIRGAFDARLHPQVPGAEVPPRQEIPVSQKLLGAVAAIGAIAWLLGLASMLVLPPDQEYGGRNISLAVVGIGLGMALIGTALGELGTRPGSPDSERTGHTVAALSVAFGVLTVLPWPFIIFGIMGFHVLAITAVVRGFQNRVMPGWFVILFVIATIASFAAAMGPDARNGAAGPVLLGSMALAAVALAWLALTRHTAAPEVSPA